MNRIIEEFVKEDFKEENLNSGIVKVNIIDSTVHIFLPREEHVIINTVSGLLYKEAEMEAGNYEINLSSGTYFIQIAGRTYRVTT